MPKIDLQSYNERIISAIEKGGVVKDLTHLTTNAELYSAVGVGDLIKLQHEGINSPGVWVVRLKTADTVKIYGLLTGLIVGFVRYAANKDDTKHIDVTDCVIVNLSGVNPTTDNDYAIKKYVDDNTDFVDLTGLEQSDLYKALVADGRPFIPAKATTYASAAMNKLVEVYTIFYNIHIDSDNIAPMFYGGVGGSGGSISSSGKFIHLVSSDISGYAWISDGQLTNVDVLLAIGVSSDTKTKLLVTNSTDGIGSPSFLDVETLTLHFDDGTSQAVKVGGATFTSSSDEPEDDGTEILSNKIPLHDTE